MSTDEKNGVRLKIVLSMSGRVMLDQMLLLESFLMTNKFRPAGYHPIRKLKVIFAGLHVAVVTDFSVAYKVILSIPILGAAFIFRRWVDVGLILLAMGLVLIAELFNSAIEVLCDFVEPQHNDRIRIIKDIAAAAAGISILVWAAILILEIIRLFQLNI
jgi:diacylglycerol kinase